VGAAVAREGRYGISWSLSKVSFADGIEDLLLYSSFLQKGFLCIASKEALLKESFFMEYIEGFLDEIQRICGARFLVFFVPTEGLPLYCVERGSFKKSLLLWNILGFLDEIQRICGARLGSEVG